MLDPEPHWKQDASHGELRSIASLDLQIAVVKEKLAPHLERLGELRKQRWTILNRASCRSSYRRGVVARSRMAKRMPTA